MASSTGTFHLQNWHETAWFTLPEGFHKTQRQQKLIGVEHIVSAAAIGNEIETINRTLCTFLTHRQSSTLIKLQSKSKESCVKLCFIRLTSQLILIPYPRRAAPTRSWQERTIASTKELACSADRVSLKLLRRIDTTTLFFPSPRRSASLQI